jgi:hypothetical protein
MQYEIEESGLSVTMTAANFDVAVTTSAPLEVAVGECARIDVGEAVNYIKSGQAEIGAAVDIGVNRVASSVTDGISDFNLNALNKTNAFNQNASDKTDAFDLNVSNKTTAFNNNASDKTTAFNNNAISKTGDFDTNATNKTNTFNQNATDKTNAFNLNATNKTTDFNDNYTAKKALIDAEVGNAAASATAADNSAKEAKQWAIGDPSEPTGNSAKYWADTAAATLANYVTINTNQDITGIKTFVGEKRVKFKQSASGNKLGFTLYDNNNKEAASFEYRPNTISGYPLMYLGQYIGSGGVSYVTTPIYVGFRCYDNYNTASYNLVAPLAKDAKSSFSLNKSYKTFYLPLGITDGNTTVTTASTGLLDISSLLPSVPTVNNATLTITQGGVSKGTFTANASSDVTIDLDAGGSSYTAGTGIDITSNTISVTSPTLTNTATGADSVGILSPASSQIGSVGVGANSTLDAAFGVAIGYQSRVAISYATALGYSAKSQAYCSIQLGYGVNSVQGTFNVGFFKGTDDQAHNWNMLDGTTGLIPDARISTNIARSSDIPTVDQTYDGTSANAQSGVAIASAISTTLSTLYPVGSIYIGTQSTCPLATLISGSTWALVATDKALWGGDGTNADTTIAAGLPNITGNLNNNGDRNIFDESANGCFQRKGSTMTTWASSSTSSASSSHKVTFDASKSNSIYGASSTVQPPAYRVNVWRRTV